MNRKSLIALIPLLCLFSCKPQVVSERPTIQYISEVIGDRSNPYHHMMEGFSEKDANANIVVFGPLDEVRSMSHSMLFFDRFDNVSARAVRDSLPDFSGEVITRVVMVDKSPLGDFINNEQRLRELTVKAALASIDTLSFRTPNDLSSFSHKTKGKIVVLTSSAMAAYGKYDLDSLLRAFKVKESVFFPLELMADKALSVPESRIGIVTKQSATIYDEYFKYREDAQGHFIKTFTKESVLDSISVVDSLALDVLMIDDYSVRPDSLRARFPKVQVIDPREATDEACYKALRKRNAFTHRVAYPRRDTYTAILNEDSEYILIDSDDRELL